MVGTYTQEAVRAARPWKPKVKKYSRAPGLSTSDKRFKEWVMFNPNRVTQHREVAVCHGRFVKRRGGHSCG